MHATNVRGEGRNPLSLNMVKGEKNEGVRGKSFILVVVVYYDSVKA